jgi:hypothetical protein
MGRASITLIGHLAFGVVAALLCGASGQARAASAQQQVDLGNFQAANAKATEYCNTLWSDHAFAPLRDKLPLLPGEQPTSSMLTNPQRVRPEDKPLADLALQTNEKCKAAYASAYAMLPSSERAKLLGISRKSAALVKQLTDGKITFGEYNVQRIEILKQAAVAFSDIWEVRPRETAQSAVTAPKPLPPQKRPSEQPTPQTSAPHEVRIALVIGESRYVNLPRLINPERDARSIAETLQKMGYNTHLLLDASEDDIRKEIRKFASESSKAEVAVVFYAGHGAQLNGSNYLLPLDIDVPRPKPTFSSLD